MKDKLNTQDVWKEIDKSSEFRVLRKGIFYEPLISNVEKQSLYCFTRDELAALLGGTFYAGTLHESGFITGELYPSQQTFIDNLFQPLPEPPNNDK